jgi:hypothetical protein
MPREAELFKVAKGSIVEAYFLMRKEGGKKPFKNNVFIMR